MRKEAVNTFGEGLVMDLHPLTTPNNVLTNCLNGTIITYNGNEFVLQNDMGNGEVHTAYLDKGYVPVGMKEHGGIIYVVAHNPITGKGQIGSFPSPQQLYEGEDLNVAPIHFDFSNFVEMRGSIPFIKLEYFKQKLFQVNNSEEVKIFHPGDRFVIVTDFIASEIREAINKGVVKLRLGVINSSGNIDYIDENNLKLYSNGLWIYESSNEEMADIIRSKEIVQVFSAKSSGALILVIELKTFDTFNLIRKYSCDDSNLISVKFIGETTGVYTGTTEKNSSEIGLLESTDSVVRSSITKSGRTGKQTYKIMPACPYGVLERMAKIGTIDFDAIRANAESLSEWRFYVTDTYLKIGWGYDYYNMNENSDITKIEFTFISVTNSADASRVQTLGGEYKYTVSKEYYNGSFEEIILFDSKTIRKNWVYIVRIDRYVGSTKKDIGYKLVYTGGYFNDVFGETPDFSALPSGSNREKIQLTVKHEINANVKKNNETLAIKVHDATSFTNKNYVTPSDYIKEVPSLNTNVASYRYNSQKTGVYDVTIRPAAEYDFDEKLYAGTPDPSLMKNFFGVTPTIKSSKFDDSGMAFSNETTIKSEISTVSSRVSKAFTYDKEELKGQVSTTRNILAVAGPVKNETKDVEKLMPVYESNMSVTERDKLYSFRNTNDTLTCVVGDEDYICYNAKIPPNVEHTTGDEYKGVNGGAGHDDDGLNVCLANMGNGTIGIFGGCDEDHASYRIEGAEYSTGAWFRDKSEIDNEDNFLLATWKDSNGWHRPVNLGSRKNEKLNPSSTTTLIRVDRMLNCFLSQMLVVKRGSKNTNYVGPDSSNFVYHNSYDTVGELTLSVDKAGTNVDVNIYMDGSNDSLETHMSRWVSAINSISPTSNFKNYLPLFYIHKPSDLPVTVYFGDTITFDNDSTLLNCYTSAYSYYTSSKADLGSINRGQIYIGVHDGTTANPDGSMNLKKNTDDTYQVKDTSTTTSSVLVDWVKRSVNLGYNVNSRFTTAYKLMNMQGEIPSGFYNEVLVNANNVVSKIGTWVKKKDGDAPDMVTSIGFGSKSIFKY